MLARKSTDQKHQLVERITGLYGDLVFDLCESVLWGSGNAQLAFRTVMKKVRATHPKDVFQENERAWILRLACDELRRSASTLGRRLTAAEQIMLDASLQGDARLKQFESYFHRLSTEDQILMLLRDKYGLPYREVSAAMGIPEGTLKVKRQQILRTLEEWIWEPA